MASELGASFQDTGGPRVLGRGLIVKPGQHVPEAFANIERTRITPGTLKDPQSTADQLHHNWVQRQPVVIELDVEPNALKQALQETDDREPWVVGEKFLFHAQH